MEGLQLLIDLHKGANRQGPGGDVETAQAFGLASIDRSAPLHIADIGCGTGAATLTLARLLNAQITAVDVLQDFLHVLDARARRAGVANRITPLCASMDDLPFDEEAFDVIWSEGAVYNIGFEKGVVDWRRYLQPGGLLVVSEITWISDARPAPVQRYWEQAYPEIDTASAKMRVLEKSGYSPIGYFVLPEHCWLENYYCPLQASFPAFLQRNGNSEEARVIVDADRAEIEMYNKYKAYYSYGVYIARKRPASPIIQAG